MGQLRQRKAYHRFVDSLQAVRYLQRRASDLICTTDKLGSTGQSTHGIMFGCPMDISSSLLRLPSFFTFEYTSNQSHCSKLHGRDMYNKIYSLSLSFTIIIERSPPKREIRARSFNVHEFGRGGVINVCIYDSAWHYQPERVLPRTMWNPQCFKCCYKRMFVMNECDYVEIVNAISL